MSTTKLVAFGLVLGAGVMAGLMRSGPDGTLIITITLFAAAAIASNDNGGTGE